MSGLRSRVNEELAALARRHRTLKQQHVLDAARKKGTALHEDFERQGLWDDASAAERARLDYAARLIRIYLVKPSEDDQARPVRALVSLMEDRKNGSGFPGYRRIEDVMRDDDLREGLVATALMELRALRRKYEDLKALADVWKAVDKAEASHLRQRPREGGSRATA